VHSRSHEAVAESCAALHSEDSVSCEVDSGADGKAGCVEAQVIEVNAEFGADVETDVGTELGAATSRFEKPREVFWALKRERSPEQTPEVLRRRDRLARKLRHIPIVYCIFSYLQVSVLFGSLWILRPGTPRERNLREEFCGDSSGSSEWSCWKYHIRLCLPCITAVLVVVTALPVAVRFDFDLLWGTMAEGATPKSSRAAATPRRGTLLRAAVRPNVDTSVTTVAGSADLAPGMAGIRGRQECRSDRGEGILGRAIGPKNFRRWYLYRSVLVGVVLAVFLQEGYAYALPSTVPSDGRWTPGLVVTLLPVVLLAIPLLEFARFQVTEGRYGDPWWDLRSLPGVFRNGVVFQTNLEDGDRVGRPTDGVPESFGGTCEEPGGVPRARLSTERAGNDREISVLSVIGSSDAQDNARGTVSGGDTPGGDPRQAIVSECSSSTTPGTSARQRDDRVAPKALSLRSFNISGSEFRRRFRRNLLNLWGGMMACSLPFGFIFFDMAVLAPWTAPGTTMDDNRENGNGSETFLPRAVRIWLWNCLRIFLLILTRKITSVAVHRCWGDGDVSTVAKMRLVNYLPVMVGGFNGTTTAFFLLGTRHVSGFILYFLVDWFIFLLRLSVVVGNGSDGVTSASESLSRPRGTLSSSTSRGPGNVSETALGPRVPAWSGSIGKWGVCRCLMYCVQWGRPNAVGGMNQRELHGWILICESLLQTTVFMAFVLLHPLLEASDRLDIGRSDVRRFGWNLYFPTEMSIVWLCVGMISEVVQDWGGHAYIMFILDCDYTRHLGGTLRDLSRFCHAGWLAITYCAVPSVGAQQFVWD